MENTLEKNGIHGISGKIGSLAKEAIKVLVVIVAIAAGFASSEIYRFIGEKSQEKNLQSVRKIQSTSIATNERGELIIFDRTTGDYQIFEDSIGIQIFKMYANSIHTRIKNETK